MSDIIQIAVKFAALGMIPMGIGFAIGWAEQLFCAVADLE